MILTRQRSQELVTNEQTVSEVSAEYIEDPSSSIQTGERRSPVFANRREAAAAAISGVGMVAMVETLGSVSALTAGVIAVSTAGSAVLGAYFHSH
jgi:hypothetical protein